MTSDDAFLQRLERSLVRRSLSPPQRDGFLLVRTRSRDAGASLPQTAYILATAYHETAGTMQPIRERGGPAYLTRLYDIAGRDPARARAHGNTSPGDGLRYAGRGFVQLTWKTNYARVGALLGRELVAEPDLALDPAIAAAILVRGMLEGWFTGRRLPEFVDGAKRDFVQARRVVNGLDRAETIAGLAEAMLAALPPLSPTAWRRPRAAAPSRPPAHP
jgi:hypothetical protein